MVSDEELATELKQGSEKALEAIVCRYHGPIHAYILRMSGDYHTTLDITQEVFIKMCKGIVHYRPDSPFRTWLYSIANNTYKDYRKKAYVRKVVIGLEPAGLPADSTDTPEETFLGNSERIRLKELIYDLGDIYRQVLVLRFFEDLKLDEIAVILSIPVGTVKSRLSTGLAQLKRLLSAEEGC